MNEELTPSQLAVIQRIVGGATVSKAARLVGIHRSTIYVWLRSSPAFAAALDHYQGEVARAGEERLRELVTLAYDALEECLAGPGTTPAVRFRAAAYVLAESAGIRHNSTPAEIPGSGPPPPCDTLKTTTHETSIQRSVAAAVAVVEPHFDDSHRPAGFRPRRRTYFPSQMLRLPRLGATNERPPA